MATAWAPMTIRFDVDRRLPPNILAVDHIGSRGPAGQCEAAPEPLAPPLAARSLALAASPAGSPTDAGCWDDRDPVLLVRVAEDPLHGNGVARLRDDLLHIHGPSPSCRRDLRQECHRSSFRAGVRRGRADRPSLVEGLGECRGGPDDRRATALPSPWDIRISSEGRTSSARGPRGTRTGPRLRYPAPCEQTEERVRPLLLQDVTGDRFPSIWFSDPLIQGFRSAGAACSPILALRRGPRTAAGERVGDGLHLLVGWPR